MAAAPFRLSDHWEDPDPSTSARAEALGYKVLRKLAAFDLPLVARTEGAINITFGDTETTGLQLAPDGQDCIWEIGLISVDFCPETMNPLGIVARVSELEEPPVPISEEALRVTGVDPSSLVGKKFNNEAVLSVLGNTDLFIAHNAAFDSRGIFARWPSLNGKMPVADAMAFDWKSLGTDSRSLGSIATLAGVFNGAHRAVADAEMLYAMCAHFSKDGKSVLHHLYLDSFVEEHRILLMDTNFNTKDRIKEVEVNGAKYRWSDGTEGIDKGWHITLPSTLAAEIEAQHAFGRELKAKIKVDTLTCYNKYQIDLSRMPSPDKPRPRHR